MKTLVLLGLLGLFPSCILGRASMNEPLLPETLRKIEPGRTRAAEVVALLGAPNHVARLHEGSAWLYEHTASKASALFLGILFLGNLDSRQDRAWVFFDENGVVTHLGKTLAAKRVEYAFPWEDLHDEIEEDGKEP